MTSDATCSAVLCSIPIITVSFYAKLEYHDNMKMHKNMFSGSEAVTRIHTDIIGTGLQLFTVDVSEVAKLRIQWYIWMVTICISAHQK
jgi:hypothetical protein